MRLILGGEETTKEAKRNTTKIEMNETEKVKERDTKKLCEIINEHEWWPFDEFGFPITFPIEFIEDYYYYTIRCKVCNVKKYK